MSQPEPPTTPQSPIGPDQAAPAPADPAVGQPYPAPAAPTVGQPYPAPADPTVGQPYPAPTQPAAPYPPGYAPVPTYPPVGTYPPGSYPPGYPPAGYPPLGGPAQPGVNGFAIAALICGICGAVGLSLILAVVFGVIALSQIKRTGQRGKGMAIAGVSLAAFWLVALVTVIAVSLLVDTTTTVANPTITSHSSPTTAPGAGEADVDEPTSVDLEDLRPGQCVEHVDERVVDSLTVVACTSPHDAEMMGTFDMPAGPYPGDKAVEDAADRGCDDQLDTYAPNAGPDVYPFLYMPTEKTWAFDDRTVLCLAATDSPRTSPLR